MDGLIMAAQIILSLSILVGVHELGHLVAAKVFGMRVEQYSIGFPPKLFGVKYGETEYSVGAIPLGGYVKISGMIDESLDTESLSAKPQEWEFRAKPAWQRLIVMMGGIVVNIVAGVIIYTSLVYFYGDTYISKEEMSKYGIVALEVGKEIGFETGDKIIKINGQDFKRFADIRSAEVLLGDNSYYTVDRNGELIDIVLPSDFLDRISDRRSSQLFIDIRYPFEVGNIGEGTEAERIGLQNGDKIVEIAGQPVKFFDEYEAIKQQNKNREVSMVVNRSGQLINMQVYLDEEAIIGFYPRRLITPSYTQYSFLQSIGEGSSRAFSAIYVNVKALGKIFRGEVSATKSLSGPIGIAQIFGGTWDWYRFWTLTGLLSMVLAFMNFLPIPALDGGHVLFLSYEIVSGRKPSDKFLVVSQKVGMIFLLGLMAFVIFNDIFKLEFIQSLFGN